MDVREKLVKLVEYMDGVCPSGVSCYNCPHKDIGEGCSIQAKVDYLIKGGVTVQECGHWISLTECANAGVYCSVCHKKVYKEDYAWCNRKNKLRSDYCPHCGAKMTPQPPKGE